MMSALRIEASGDEDVPAWSGQLEHLGAGVALLSIHVADTSCHPIPRGYNLHPCIESPLYTEDAEVWVLVRD